MMQITITLTQVNSIINTRSNQKTAVIAIILLISQGQLSWMAKQNMITQTIYPGTHTMIG